MTLQIGRVSLSIATNAIASVSAPGPRGPLVIVGPCAAGPLNTMVPVNNKATVLSTFSHGPIVEAAAYALGYEVDRLFMVRTDTALGTPGAYGTVGVDGTGFNAVADTVVLPADDLEVVVEFANAGTVGIAGIRYRYSLDGGRKFSGEIALGTATSITLPLGGGKFNLYPNEAAFVALVVEIRTDFLAHENYITGGVHGMADPNTYTITVPTDYDTALTALGELITAMATHVVELGGVHAAADTTAQTALAALSAPTTIYEGNTVANALKSILNTHEGPTTVPAIHGAADTANNVTAANATITITAGNAFDCVTTAPRWSIEELVAALEVLRDTTLRFGTIEIVGPFGSVGELVSVHSTILDMRTKVKYRRAIGHFRARNEGETLLAYSQAFEALVTTADTDTIALTPSWYAPSRVNVGAVYVRPYSFHAAPRTSKLRENVSASSRRGFGKGVGFLRDSGGQVLPRAVDEAFQELFTPLRGFAPRTWADKPDTEVYGGQSATLAAEGSDTQTLDVAQVLDIAAETAFSPLADRIGENLVPAPDNTLEKNEQNRIEEQVSKILAAKMVGEGLAVGARLVLDAGQVIVSNDPVRITGKVLVRIFGKVTEFAIEIAVDATPAN